MSIPPLMRCFHVGLDIASCSQLRGYNASLSRLVIKTGLRLSSLTRLYSSVPVNGKIAYLNLQTSPDQVQIKHVFSHTLANVLNSLNIRQSSTSLDQKWNYLQQHLLSYHDYKLSPFDPDNDINNLQVLLSLFQRPLVKESQMINSPTLSDYIFTPSEVFWGTTPDIKVPFTTDNAKIETDLTQIQDILDQSPVAESLPVTFENETDNKVQSYALLNCNRDATAATLLAIPHLDATTFLYEVGCWHGQNLLNLLFYASLKGRAPKQCVGIDINPQALTMAQSVSNMVAFQEPYLQFHLSNALYPLNSNFVCKDFLKEVRLALRIIPVLEPNQAKVFLQKTRKELKSNNDVMIVSFALPKGKRYQENIERAGKPPFKKEEFIGGVVFFQKFDPLNDLPPYLQGRSSYDAVLNTYYTIDGFRKLVEDCGFSIDHSILVSDFDNERMTVQLRPK